MNKFKWSRISLLTFMLMLVSTFSFAQKTSQYTEVLKEKELYYKSLGYKPDKVEKELEKFRKYWTTRLTEEGDLGYIKAAFPESIGEGKSAGTVCSSDEANWEIVGPLYSDFSAWDSQAGISHDQWQGKMEEVYAPADRSYFISSSAHGGIWKRNTGDAGWTNVTASLNLPSINVNTISANPYNENQLFASCGIGGHGYGILTSTDAGDTWTELTTFSDAYTSVYPRTLGNENNINTGKVIIDPHTSTAGNATLYAITREDDNNTDIWYSVNSGVSWTQFTTPALTPKSYWGDIEVDDEGNLLCTTEPGQYGNSAAYWYFDHTIGWIDRSAQFPHTTYIFPYPGNFLNNVIKLTEPYGDIVYALRDRYDFVCNCHFPVREIFESTDGGITFNLIRTISPTGGLAGVIPKTEIQYSPLVNKVFVGGNRLYEIDPLNLTAPQSTISIKQGHIDVRDVYMVESGSQLYIYTANDGGISEVTYNGTPSTSTYTNLNGNYLPVSEFTDIGTANTSNERYIGGVAHNHAFRYNNGNWKKFGAGDGDAAVINPDNPDIGYVVYAAKPKGYDFLTDNVYNLSDVSGVSPINHGGAQFFNRLQLHPADSDILFFANRRTGPASKLYLNVWTESTNTWENREILDGIYRAGEIGISKSSPGRIYLAEKEPFGDWDTDRLIRSDAGGATGSWTSIGTADVYDATGTTFLETLNEATAHKVITDIEVSPYNQNVLWISISGFMNEDEKRRVLKSTDGGDTWREFSQGLARYPVHALVLIPSTNGLMFAGTESGIYYRDNSMSQWECFKNGMPNNIITDLDYNTCTGNLVAATYGNGIWKSEIPRDFSPLTYASNTTFPAVTIEINTDILIKAPATVTVLGTIEMANNRTITVEPGATLIIDGGKITNQCDKLWGGIQLGGTPSVGQSSEAVIVDPNQGTLILRNGTIEHAKTGVTTKAYAYGFGHGGRIFSDNSTFIDNRFDVEMLSYSFNNVSYFRSTDFLTTAPLPDPIYSTIDPFGRELGTAIHVKLWEVNHVEFNQNRFINSGTFDNDIRGVGIYSLDANYNVVGECLSPAPPSGCDNPALSFKNLSQGIVFNSTDNSHTLKVANNKFNNVMQSVYAIGGENIRVDNNHFINYGGISSMKAWGTYVEGVEGVTISDNMFAENGTSPNTVNLFARGVIVQNTSATRFHATNIMRNEFREGKMVGIQGWFKNPDLQIWCNEFSSNYGIYVGRQSSFSPESTLPTQGTVDRPAGNRFFYNCNTNFNHIYFDGVNPLNPGNETALIYRDYFAMPNPPVCISNDGNPAPYVSNPAPGNVIVNLVARYSEASCVVSNTPVGSGGGSRSTENNTDLNIEEEEERLIEFIAKIKEEGRTLKELNESEVHILSSLSSEMTVLGSKSKAILGFYNEEINSPYVAPITFGDNSVDNSKKLTQDLVLIYPNPSQKETTITLTTDSELVKIKVFDMTGKLQFEANNESIITLDVSDWASGVYFVSIQLDEEQLTEKFVVK